MGAEIVWNVRVRKSYSETIQVHAVTSDEAYEAARQEPGVVMIENVQRDDPNEQVPNVKLRGAPLLARPSRTPC